MHKLKHLIKAEGYAVRTAVPLFLLFITLTFFTVTSVTAEDNKAEKPIAAPHIMSDEELDAFIKSYQDKVLDNENAITQLKDEGLPTYNPQMSLKEFCNKEAAKIDAVAHKNLYTMNEVPYYQCKAIADFYCFHKKPKKACVERDNGSVCENPTGVDEDCEPFRDFIKKAYSPNELRKQHQKLLDLVTQRPHD